MSNTHLLLIILPTWVLLGALIAVVIQIGNDLRKLLDVSRWILQDLKTIRKDKLTY